MPEKHCFLVTVYKYLYITPPLVTCAHSLNLLCSCFLPSHLFPPPPSLFPLPSFPLPSPQTDPGTCYVCNSCTFRDNGQSSQMCEGETPHSDRITSDCVETTAYTLLALLEAGETDRTACLAQWLIKQQNSFGTFGSSQVNH